MPRRKSITASIEKTVCLRPDLVAQVDLLLYSELEGKVPFGSWKRFIEEAIQEKLQRMRVQEVVNVDTDSSVKNHLQWLKETQNAPNTK